MTTQVADMRTSQKLNGKPLVIETAQHINDHILNEFDIFVFDMDGVLYKGDTAIEGAAEALQYLKMNKKQLFFATNNPLKRSAKVSEIQIAEKLKQIGLGDHDPSCIFNSANAAAIYLQQLNYKGKVYMIGHDALREELEQLSGIELIDGYDHRDKFPFPSEVAKEEIDTSIGAVVMGFDPYFNYYKACYATAVLTHNPNCQFVVTNPDIRFPSSRYVLPGTGAFVSAVETATGRKATIAGKPGLVILREIERCCPNTTRNRMCMVGDNLKTDIHFGKSFGLGTLFVETGVDNRSDFPDAPSLPDYVIPSIANLVME